MPAATSSAKAVRRAQARRVLTQLPFLARLFGLRARSRRYGYLQTSQGVAESRRDSLQREFRTLVLLQSRRKAAEA